MPRTADLVTIPNVELIEVGTWRCSNGIFTWTLEDLAAAVQAQADPAYRTPVIKLGHVDPRFDGQPAFGRIENLRTTNNGMTLVGDFTGVPAVLAAVMPSAYPDRSIEGTFGMRYDTGSEHRFVLTAVALLGEQPPAISTLEDIAVLYGLDTSDDDDVDVAAAAGSGGVAVTVTATRENLMPANPRASVNLDSLRQAFYGSDVQRKLGAWAWVREVWTDYLIVDDDEGHLYRVPWTEADGGTAEFGEPEEVRVEYVAAATARASASPAQRPIPIHVFDRPLREPAATSVPEGTVTEEVRMPQITAAQLAALGLTEDATQEQVDARLAEVATAATTTPPAPAGDPAPATPASDTTPAQPVAASTGLVQVDPAVWEQTRRDAAAGAAAAARQRTEDRDRFLDDAVKAGKFPPARLDHWQKLYDADEQGTRATVDALASGLIPVTEQGSGGPTDPAASGGDNPYPTDWFPELAARG